MILNPARAAEMVHAIANVSPVFAQQGERKGKHVLYQYRFGFHGSLLRHISIATRPNNEGVTVYVNKYSAANVPFPATGIGDIRVTFDYPAGYEGKTGDKGIASSVASLSSLNPAKNDVLRLSLASESELMALLGWYFDNQAVESPLPASAIPNIVGTPDSASHPLMPAVSAAPAATITSADQAHLQLDTASLNTSEREAVVKVRFGQGRFRDALISIAGAKCWMSGIEGRALLIASHIKPWAACDTDTTARGNPDNGLLLSALWDAAFDAGLVSFGQDWRILVARELPRSAIDALWATGADTPTLPEQFRSPGRARFLEHHRSAVFRHAEK